MSAVACSSDDAPSALDEMAGAAVRLVLMGAVKKPAAMQALARLAMDELATLEGDANASQFAARRARIHHERSLNKLTRGSRR